MSCHVLFHLSNSAGTEAKHVSMTLCSCSITWNKRPNLPDPICQHPLGTTNKMHRPVSWSPANLKSASIYFLTRHTSWLIPIFFFPVLDVSFAPRWSQISAPPSDLLEQPNAAVWFCSQPSCRDGFQFEHLSEPTHHIKTFSITFSVLCSKYLKMSQIYLPEPL